MKKKLVIIDNYDSFTYNLYHLVKELGCTQVDVVRNDKFRLEEIDQYDKILLSPGPGIPSEAGLLLPVIKRYANSKSMLGVCLGHQAIAENFGATLINLEDVYHGVATLVKVVSEDIIFKGLPHLLEVGRYHSWAVSPVKLPSCIRITAIDEEGAIMALRHETYDVHGIQFHPESILTPKGKEMVANWLKY
ncbi:anthranilate synthase component II [Parabacteroides pacaensis]|uniref:anthranilate synthase component II n=1 Tax=Parabacteroides pacaensis TaxID=2086575 RepID=UPI000D0FC43B|nr:aminodeoxychorismate/anthranilate synthase component II [Parabacteroides pacaensis]